MKSDSIHLSHVNNVDCSMRQFSSLWNDTIAIVLWCMGLGLALTSIWEQFHKKNNWCLNYFYSIRLISKLHNKLTSYHSNQDYLFLRSLKLINIQSDQIFYRHQYQLNHHHHRPRAPLFPHLPTTMSQLHPQPSRTLRTKLKMIAMATPMSQLVARGIAWSITYFL